MKNDDNMYIDGYGNKYVVTKDGEVWNTLKGTKLKKRPNGAGYYEVDLIQNSQSKRRYVHRLVAQAFIPNPDGKPQVNHIDNDPNNNHVTNLEWATSLENVGHGKYTPRKPHIKGGLIPKTAYFKTQEDADRFNAIKNKTEWLHDRLNPLDGTATGLAEAKKRFEAAHAKLVVKATPILDKANRAVKSKLCLHGMDIGNGMMCKKGCK